MFTIENATTGEAQEAARLVGALTAAGYLLSVYDGEAYTVKQSDNPAAILSALATTGADVLRVRDPSYRVADGDRMVATKVGTVTLVWGNAHDGSELVSDWSWTNSPLGIAFDAFMRRAGY